MGFQTAAAVAVLIAGSYFLIRRADVRLVLALSATALFALAGRLPQMLVIMAKEMANPETVVPICSAIGFAYVLKLTECDKHLVQLLLNPLRLRVFRFLLLPGGVAVAYLVNIPIVSQTGVAAVVGPILIPLLLANRISPVTAGAMLLLGSSMGGELFNPGAVEMGKLSQLTATNREVLVTQIAPINLTACAVVLLVFWRLAIRWERGRQTEEPSPTAGLEPRSEVAFRINPIKAFVPILPLLLLFLFYRGYLRLPGEIGEYVTILFALLIGVTAAALTSPRLAGKLSGAFFEGAGYAYTHVISLIVTAKIFTEGIKANGLMETLVGALAGQPILAVLASILLPWLLAVISGSGIAPTVAVMDALIPSAARLHLDPVQMGGITAMAAHFGRTMSPAAAVVMMCATLTGTETLALVRRVAPPLLIGLCVLFVLALLRVVIR